MTCMLWHQCVSTLQLITWTTFSWITCGCPTGALLALPLQSLFPYLFYLPLWTDAFLLLRNRRCPTCCNTVLKSCLHGAISNVHPFVSSSLVQVGDVVAVVAKNGKIAKATVVGFGHRSSKPRNLFTVILTLLIFQAACQSIMQQYSILISLKPFPQLTCSGQCIRSGVENKRGTHSHPHPIALGLCVYHARLGWRPSPPSGWVASNS